MGTWDYSIFWKETVNQLKNELTEQEFSMWFNFEYETSTESSIILSVPSAFYRDQVKQRYQTKIEGKIFELSGQHISIEFEIKARKKENTIEEPQNILLKKNSESPVISVKTTTEQDIKHRDNHPQLRKDYIFDNFIIGENNSFAANAAIAIAKNPGLAYNPCLIYGGVGLGKTHLMQAIGNLSWKEKGCKIIYITAENFTNEFVESIKNNKTQDFKNKYRNADMLLIDDIHFLQKKNETQEELFHTFNALYDANKQIIFTCDRPVSELKNLSERLRSRFERGLNVDLQPPNYETRCAILSKKIELRGITIPQEVLNLVARNISSNVRDLEASLTKLIAYAELTKKPVTLETAQQQLRDSFGAPKQNNVTIETIQKVVADYFSLSYTDLKGKKRTKAVSFPRQLAMYIAREITEYSTTELGMEFGGRDHTTVMHGCQKIEERLKAEPSLETTIQKLTKLIKDYNS
ncbi:MAG: chromosomal replication initiator protein DnaA [Spirochaetaceae bacterium]|nr:chromosomal replication initiator protein DnaA [Spirochaetaceae bacterium]